MSVNYGKGPVIAEETVSAPLKFFFCDFCRDQGTPPPGRPSGYIWCDAGGVWAGVCWKTFVPHLVALYSAGVFILFLFLEGLRLSHLLFEKSYEKVVTVTSTEWRFISMISFVGFWVFSRLWIVTYLYMLKAY